MKPFQAAILCIVYSGCAMASGPNHIEFTKGPIFGVGTTSSNVGDTIKRLEIDLSDSDDRSLVDLVVRIDGRRTDVASLSREQLRGKGAKVWEGESKRFGGTETFYISGYGFRFDGDRLIGFRMNLFEWPAVGKEVNPEIGLKDDNRLLALPVSLAEFEKVFGESDEIKRGFRW